jgi:hypothetical protein
MAKKRKTTAKKPIRKPSKASADRAKRRKLSHDENVTALVIAVAIVILFAALYLYQQNVKPKAALLDGGPAIVTVEKA